MVELLDGRRVADSVALSSSGGAADIRQRSASAGATVPYCSLRAVCTTLPAARTGCAPSPLLSAATTLPRRLTTAAGLAAHTGIEGGWSGL